VAATGALGCDGTELELETIVREGIEEDVVGSAVTAGLGFGGSCLATGFGCDAATVGLCTGFVISSKLDASSSSSDSSASFSANLLAAADMDCWFSLISVGRDCDTGLFAAGSGTGTASAFGFGGSVFVGVGAATGVSLALYSDFTGTASLPS
jgi:hypothetical protein